MLVFGVLTAFLVLAFAILSNQTGLFGPGTGLMVIVLIFAPLVMRVPRARMTLSERLTLVREAGDGPAVWLAFLGLLAYYRDYLDQIRLTRVRPFLPLLALGLSCWVILALCQATGTIVFRIAHGEPLPLSFVLSTLSIAEDLPPQSTGLFTSFWVVFEEIAWRGIFLSFFLLLYRRRKAVAMAALGFSLLHLLNLTSGRPPIWVLGQLIWSFSLGLWYGYSVVKTDSLIPAMLVHWLGNAFIYSLTSHLQLNASAEVQALYNVVFSLGLLPAILLFLWVRFITRRWPVFRQVAAQS